MNTILLLFGLALLHGVEHANAENAGIVCNTDEECPTISMNGKNIKTTCDTGLKSCIILVGCWADGTPMPETNAHMCCSRIVNTYMPRNQSRCGLIPNNYYCSKDGDCQSNNCGAYGGSYRHSSTRTCAPKNEKGWQVACRSHSECTPGLLCQRNYHICDCDVNDFAAYTYEAICCSTGNVPANSTTCVQKNAGDSCQNDIQCADGGEKSKQEKSCNGEICVTVVEVQQK